MRLREDLSKKEKRVIRSVFWYSWTMSASRTGVTQYHAVDVMYTLPPAINRFYKTKEEWVEALVRHTIWFSVIMHINNFIMGLAVSMEKRNSEDENFGASSIIAVKASPMGPFLGIGDSFFWGILRAIAAGIGISLTSTGSPLGAIAFLLLCNVPALLIYYYASYSNYPTGEGFIQRMYESGGVKILTKVSNMLGLVTMSSMTASSIKLKTILEVSVKGNEDVVKIQDYLDQLFVGTISLVMTLLVFWPLCEKVNANVVMSGIIFLGVSLGLLGIC